MLFPMIYEYIYRTGDFRTEPGSLKSKINLEKSYLFDQRIRLNFLCFNQFLAAIFWTFKVDLGGEKFVMNKLNILPKNKVLKSLGLYREWFTSLGS